MKKTTRVVLNLTSEEIADLASAVVTLRESRVSTAEWIELDGSKHGITSANAQRLAERARALSLKVSVAIDTARKGGKG